MLRNINITDEEDGIVWGLEKSSQYSTKSMYRHLSFGGVINTNMQEMWRSRVPLKVSVFLWQMLQDKILSREQ